ncbi:hypothetical protein Cni_G12156 [Canna indica]|uniref:Uncharacterized protein n=1 Tax=Canna indica TaxID=4628 RepID=A0AAQ3QBI9_9LILI|nr:hypothetical protein Cni_G12156 [Canna indica]
MAAAIAYAYAELTVANSTTPLCLVWMGDLIDTEKSSGGEDLYLRLSDINLDSEPYLYRSGEDLASWKWTASGKFSTNSLYHLPNFKGVSDPKAAFIWQGVGEFITSSETLVSGGGSLALGFFNSRLQMPAIWYLRQRPSGDSSMGCQQMETN